MLHFYRFIDKSFEYCFYVETSAGLSKQEIKKLKWLLSETFQPQFFGQDSFLNPSATKKSKGITVEIGPRLNFETSYSTNAVAICNSCGLNKVIRLERSHNYHLDAKANAVEFIKDHHDRMTEMQYEQPLASFETGVRPEEVTLLPLIQRGRQLLIEINEYYGLGFDAWDIDFYYNLFTKEFGRDPTNVECYHLSQANSEHSRHWFFKGKMVIDGKVQEKSLFQIIKDTLSSSPANSLIAFKDNSSAIVGFLIDTILPESPGFCSTFNKNKVKYHIIFTAETHNFPSGVAPFPGAETGTGGRIRDVEATGRGGLVVAGTAGYATGNLNIYGYRIPGEDRSFRYPVNLSVPLKILIEESNGASDYGNKFGEPVIQGFTRTFGQKLPNGERKEWIKPIMFTGGIGQIDGRHLDKKPAEKGMLIIQVGGPAYRIGLGGGSASSLIQGENREELDFNAVQRGNAEMEQKLNRVVRACVEMGDRNPILSIHDQGAGGPCNVITEIVEPAGGRINIRNITVGDKTMSVLEIWVSEYQERNAFLIAPVDIKRFRDICNREKVNCEVLGEITGSGSIVVSDSLDDSTPVDLELSKILGNIPQKQFESERIKKSLEPFKIPEDLDIKNTLRELFKLPSIGSKGFLVRKVDRSVTGLVSRQQCCGPLQLPVSDVAVIAQSHFGLTGAAISIGEQPLKILVDPCAGARMAVAEALTNMIWAKITDLSHIKCSVNWMWPAKLPGEGAELWDCANALSDLMKGLGIAADGGKDSVSMAAQVDENTVKSPGTVVVSAYATVQDIRKVVTPDLKKPGESILILIEPETGQYRLGGSALGQILSQTGDSTPDISSPEMLKNTFFAIQGLIDAGLLLSGHDRSDGGLATAISEMVMSGNCGAEISLLDQMGSLSKNSPLVQDKRNLKTADAVSQLFSEEIGLIIEVLPENNTKIAAVLNKYGIPNRVLGRTTSERQLTISNCNDVILEIETSELIQWWESTSDELEKHQMEKSFAETQKKAHIRKGPSYCLSFVPEDKQQWSAHNGQKPKVAIIREEGSNGDREMTSAFYMAGFDTWDVTMTDLLDGRTSLSEFRGAVFVGGFSYADVLDSAKGWAGIIRFNQGLSKMFKDFYERQDTFSLGVCNGCQLMTLLGWVPWDGIAEEGQPRFISNPSGRFESRWATVKILESPAIMLKGMENSVLGIWVAHREGYMHCPDKAIFSKAKDARLFPLAYVDDDLGLTEKYPFNPNSSPGGYTSICSLDGRHLCMMPHPERSFLSWQWPWVPEGFITEDLKDVNASPWLRMFQNARKWCDENK